MRWEGGRGGGDDEVVVVVVCVREGERREMCEDQGEGDEGGRGGKRVEVRE